VAELTVEPGCEDIEVSLVNVDTGRDGRRLGDTATGWFDLLAGPRSAWPGRPPCTAPAPPDGRAGPDRTTRPGRVCGRASRVLGESYVS
jgi:hypothetical protein